MRGWIMSLRALPHDPSGPAGHLPTHKRGEEGTQCGGIGMNTGGVPDIFERALMSASLAPNGFR